MSSKKTNSSKDKNNNSLNKAVDTSRKQPKWFYAVLIIIPVFTIILLEVSLRIFNYGKNLDEWIDAGEGKLKLNNYIAQRYFADETLAPIVLSQSFDLVKKENSFRVFIIGESSAAGFPFLPNGSFSNYLDQRLQLVYPESTIEVINLGITATNSYAWLDLMPGIINNKPDLIILYGGHNEYYGALGTSSTQAISSSRHIIKLYLWINQFKTTQLLSEFTKWFSSLFSKNEKTRNESRTLMRDLSSGKLIKYKSNEYLNGINQFKYNIDEILTICKTNNVPVLVSTLSSNLKDQAPFVSSILNGLSADNFFSEAKRNLRDNNLEAADSLFRLAKDYDELKFRAPEEINETILVLAKTHSVPIVNVDSLFKSLSKNSIPGDELMTDHLHPTLDGYLAMGRLFYENMIKNNFLPKSTSYNISIAAQDSIVRTNFLFSSLDSIIAYERIRVLKNDWPFRKEKNLQPSVSMKMNDFIDSLAYLVSINKIGWGQAHYICAYRFEKNGNTKALIKEYEILADNFPSHEIYSQKLITLLLKNKQTERAFYFLNKFFKATQKAEYGITLAKILISKKDFGRSIDILNSCIIQSPYDPEILYNLALANKESGNLNEAVNVLKRCLQNNPNYIQAKELLEEITFGKK